MRCPVPRNTGRRRIRVLLPDDQDDEAIKSWSSSSVTSSIMSTTAETMCYRWLILQDGNLPLGLDGDFDQESTYAP